MKKGSIILMGIAVLVISLFMLFRTDPEHVISIGDIRLPVHFEDPDIHPLLAETIITDIEFIFSHIDQVEWKEVKREREWRGLAITHALLNWRSVDLPYVFKDQFGGAGTTVDGELRLLIIQELIDSYDEVYQLQLRNPGMFEKVDEFLTILADRERLEQIAGDPDECRAYFYCPRECSGDVDRYIEEMVSAAEITVHPPSLLDIRPLSELYKDLELDPTIYVMWALIEDPNSSGKGIRWPIAAYVDDQWKFLHYHGP